MPGGRGTPLNLLPYLAAHAPPVYARMRAIAGELVASTDPTNVTVQLIIGCRRLFMIREMTMTVVSRGND
jgi:hypothetical protein